MKKSFILVFGIVMACVAMQVDAATVMSTAQNKTANQPPINISSMSAEAKGKYCQSLGYKLLNCSDPFVAGERCEADMAYVSGCVCKSEYNLSCAETDGLKGVGLRCNGLYASCCKLSCNNPLATLVSCEEQGLEEIHSERDYNECGETCYVCKDVCSKGIPENMCPNNQKCVPIEGIASRQGQRCCTCKCPDDMKECMGKCVDENECCPNCSEGMVCNSGVCVAK